jgi:hypothetical protein
MCHDHGGRRGSLPEGSEEFPEVVDDEVRDLHGREVTAALEFFPVHDVMTALGQGPDWY